MTGEIVIKLTFCIYNIILDVMTPTKVNYNLFLTGKFRIEHEVCVYKMAGRSTLSSVAELATETAVFKSISA